jgi:hypothetical protein
MGGTLEGHLERLAGIVQVEPLDHERLAGWLVELVEDPATRYDGVSDLNSSFSRLNDENYEIETGQKVVEDEYRPKRQTAEIAKSLTSGQRSRISDVLHERLQDSLADGEPDYEELLIDDVDLIVLRRNWDKSSYSGYIYALLQSSDGSDAKAIAVLMKHLAYISDDSQLRNIHYQYACAIFEKETSLEETDRIEIEAAPNKKRGSLKEKRTKLLDEFRARAEYLLARDFGAVP